MTLPPSPALGIALTVAAYWIGTLLRRRFPHPLVNPLAIGVVLVVLLIQFTPLSLGDYKPGGGIIAMFIVPATTALALQVHRQWAQLRRNVLPVLAGCLAGSVVSIGGILLLCRLLLPDEVLTASLLPKSVTTAIALELSANSGGNAALTISAVVLTGIASAILSPLLIQILKLRDPAAAGIAMGVSGHAVGTAKAIELGEIQGAMSGISLVVSGIITSLAYIFL